MSEAGAPLWTGEQHAWLRALGHAVWVPGALAAATQAAPAEVDAQPASGRRSPAQVLREAVSEYPRRQAPVEPVDAAPVAPRRAPPAATPDDTAPVAPRRAPARGSLLPDRLRIELLRASGLNPNAPEVAAIMAAWPEPASLRGNPAAKRALWPQLRALRRRTAP